MVGHASLFSQMLSLVDRHRFERLVGEHKAERGAKGFSCWSQFAVPLARSRYPRGLETGSSRAQREGISGPG